MSVDAKFNTAVEDVRKLKSKPSDNDLLELYALFKQATVGDNNTTRPGMLDLKGKAKWDAWTKKKGVDAESAKEQYVAKVASLVETLGLQ